MLFDDQPDTVTMNGIAFHHTKPEEEPGGGHSPSYDLYTLFRHGKCLVFSDGSDGYELGDDDPGPEAVVQSNAGGVDPLKTLRIR